MGNIAWTEAHVALLKRRGSTSADKCQKEKLFVGCLISGIYSFLVKPTGCI